MEAVGFYRSHDVKRSKIWVTTVINKPALIAVVGRVDTQGEEIVIVALLNFQVVIVILVWVVHVEQVTHPKLVIMLASFVAVLSCKDLSNVLNDKGAGRDRFHGIEAPHDGRFDLSTDVGGLFDPLNKDFPPVPIESLHEEVRAEVLVTAAAGVTLIKGKGPVAGLRSSHLKGD